jgi:hypothetical protein
MLSPGFSETVSFDGSCCTETGSDQYAEASFSLPISFLTDVMNFTTSIINYNNKVGYN